MKIDIENVLPADIEKRSFEIIEQELSGKIFDKDKEPIIKRVIQWMNA